MIDEKLKKIRVVTKKEKDEEVIEIDEDKLVHVNIAGGSLIVDGSFSIIQVRRGGGQLRGKALYLDDSLDYELGMDRGCKVLVPLMKEKKELC